MTHWRSMMFIPADNVALLGKARKSGADAIIIDLEDSVAPDRKHGARAALSDTIKAARGRSMSLAVRINSQWLDSFADMDAAVHPGVSAIVVPKSETKSRLNAIDEILTEWEKLRQLPKGEIKMIALIESPIGLANAADLAAVERVSGLALGTEDLALSVGISPTPQFLELPCRQIAMAAATRRLMALATPISIAEYRDREAYRSALQVGKALGCTGAICVHPHQVASANDIFGTADLAEAAAILQVWNEAIKSGRSVATLNGRMIDLPIAKRAQRTLGMEKDIE